MTQESNGGEESLAPVIPMFGTRTPRPARHATMRAIPGETSRSHADERDVEGVDADDHDTDEPGAHGRDLHGGAGAVSRRPVDLHPSAGPRDDDRHRAMGRGPEHVGPSPRGGDDRDAPEAEDDAAAEGAVVAEEWHTTWREPGGRRRSSSAAPVGGGVSFTEATDDDGEPSEQEVVEAAEARMLKALRRRSLSESEAHAMLLGDEVPRDAADEIVARFVDLGYLDDTALAEQIVHSAVTRKSQGGRAIAQALRARGISREVVEIALESLPDDEEDRALEYARGKARSLLRVDDETALRRLTGQLARRGFGGSLAMSAARRALDEARGPSSTVRFR